MMWLISSIMKNYSYFVVCRSYNILIKQCIVFKLILQFLAKCWFKGFYNFTVYTENSTYVHAPHDDTDIVQTCCMNHALTLCLPVSSADNLGKQFGPRSGLTICRA